MIAAVLIFLCAVSLLASGAAWAAEEPGALDGVLAIAWGLLSVGMLAWLVSMQGRLRRKKSGWEHLWLYDRDVYLSPDRGPAVAGVLRP